MSGYLSCAEFAKLHGISRQRAATICKNALRGKPWRGETLNVRTVNSATGGGKSGLQYEVLLSAAEGLLSDRLETPKRRAPLPAAKQSGTMKARFAMIERALECPRGSPERAAALADASARHRVTVRTLQRWIKDYEETGGDLFALANKRPKNAGQSRVIVSRQFDAAWRAAELPESQLAQMGEYLNALIVSAWQSPYQRAGQERIKREVICEWQRHCAAKGLDLPTSAFALSDAKIKVPNHHRIVDIRKHDRKRFDDTIARVNRSVNGFEPMELVVGDVKRLDVTLTRPDGTIATPRMVAFMDVATSRVFYQLFLYQKGRDVTQEDVIDTFIAMCCHHEWGFPKSLYLDNGSEYKALDRITECLAMVSNNPTRVLIKSQAYNASAKTIEQRFRRLDTQVFAPMAGYIGGDRMNAKTQTVGRPTLPYQGTIGEFECEVSERVADFELMPFKTGEQAGRSPAQIFHDFVSDGWRPIHIEPLALHIAFAKKESRKVNKGVISWKGNKWRADNLPMCRYVDFYVPYRKGQYPIAAWDECEGVFLTPDYKYGMLDTAGAQEAARRKANDNRYVGQLEKQALPVDWDANRKARLASAQGNNIVPLKPARIASMALDLSDDPRAQGIAAAMKNGDAARRGAPTAEQAAELARIAAQKQKAALLEKRHGRS